MLGVSEVWNLGILEFWSSGVWEFGILKSWIWGILQFGMLSFLKCGRHILNHGLLCLFLILST